jgi:TolA-binding protein
MKMIAYCFLILMFAVSLAPAQESATQQQLDKISGQIQDLLEAQSRQNVRIQEMERKLAELTEKVNAPVVNESASREDLRKLAEKMQEMDRKRQEDRDLMLQQIEKLAKVAAATPPPAAVHHPVRNDDPPADKDNAPKDATPQKGYEYEVQEGDNLGLILKAYHAKGVKVTKRQIIDANPKINPDVLIPGKKIFIPDAAAK